MNKAPQRPRYNEYRMPPRRPPQKKNNFAAILSVLMAVIVILIAVIVILSVVRRVNGGDTLVSGDSTDVMVTDEKDDDTSPHTQGAPGVFDNNNRHILLDPGHGFDDNGCTSKYMAGKYEKDISLAVVKMLKAELESMGYTVSLTHDGISYIDEPVLISKLSSLGLEYKPDKIIDNNIYHAYERTMYANIINKSTPVSAFVSIHVNSNQDSAALSDFTLDYCAANSSSAYSEKLVDSVLDALKSQFPQREQRRYADSWEEAFIVTKYSEMPSFLIEMGYATTPSDAAQIIDPSWQKQFADSLAKGIDSYFKNAD